MTVARDLTISALQGAYSAGSLTPTALLTELYPEYTEDPATFIAVTPKETILERCRELESLPASQRGPLYGVPFAVKDNIDALPLPTTAACPAYSYSPAKNAPCVQALIDAGGVMVGKTNMDQFATGLVGTRTPHGNARNAFDDRFIPGGSSAGSGAIVGRGAVSFALGTDTAGSGRIPAMMNGCVGVKQTVGRVSTTGVVPACRSLDVVSTFALTVADGATVVKIMQEGGEKMADPNWRPADPQLVGLRFDAGSFRFAVPGPEYLDFSGPGGPTAEQGYHALFQEAIQRLEALGGVRVAIDFEPLAACARLLYESAFVAERYSAVRAFLEKGGPGTTESVASDQRMERVLGKILSAACTMGAADVYDGLSQLTDLRAKSRVLFAGFDALLVPTALHHYTVAEIEATEKQAAVPSWPYNAKLGRFTNFVNLLDLAAVAVPSGLLRGATSDGDAPEVVARREHLAATGNPDPVLPFGVTFIGRAWTDEYLWGLAEAYFNQTGLKSMPAGHGLVPYRTGS